MRSGPRWLRNGLDRLRRVHELDWWSRGSLCRTRSRLWAVNNQDGRNRRSVCRVRDGRSWACRLGCVNKFDWCGRRGCRLRRTNTSSRQRTSGVTAWVAGISVGQHDVQSGLEFTLETTQMHNGAGGEQGKLTHGICLFYFKNLPTTNRCFPRNRQHPST